MSYSYCNHEDSTREKSAIIDYGGQKLHQMPLAVYQFKSIILTFQSEHRWAYDHPAKNNTFLNQFDRKIGSPNMCWTIGGTKK